MSTAFDLDRRDFVKGAACMGLAGLGAATVASTTAHAGEAASFTFADTIAWNAEYDVVVVGFGGAGGVASVYAADAGAKVLLCDAAPEGDEGGNTRFAAQMCVSGSDPDKLFQYYKEGLYWHYEIDDATLRAYTDGLCDMENLMKYIDAEEPVIMLPNGTIVTPEYPEFADKGGDTVVEWFVHKGMFDSALWRTIRAAVEKRADNIDVWLESPAVHMVQDPQSKTVVGVEIQRGGESVLVRARNGVVLACGGFENNHEMIQDYIGAVRLTPFGSLYNKGDGIKFGREVGADMWHMEAYESIGILAGNAWATESGRLAFEKNPEGGNPLSLESGDYGKGSIILVGDDGSRFIDENANSRHGHVYNCGVWRMPVANWAPHLIFDKTQYDVLDADGYLTEDRVAKLITAETPEELAEKIGADPAILAQTIADFNFYAENGRDYHMGRDPESMRAFDGGTYYAAEFRPGVLNTQGGPRRNENAEVLGIDGEPIPHLYSAGELGGICAFQYNSGGNLGECMVFGKIAGTNAAAEKDPLPAVAMPAAVEPAIAYNPGDVTDLGASDAAGSYETGEGEYVGTSDAGMGGAIVVKVAYADGTITAIEVLEQNETPEFGGAALEQLPGMVVEANSTEIDGVAGATITSKAFFAAVQDAIAQA